MTALGSSAGDARARFLAATADPKQHTSDEPCELCDAFEVHAFCRTTPLDVIRTCNGKCKQ